MSHYKYLDLHFDTVLTRLGRPDMIPRRGNFSSSGDKYYSYRERWEAAGIPWYHGAIMYHLLELLYAGEARQTETGWVHPWQWVINNYESGHNLSQHMRNLVVENKDDIVKILKAETLEKRGGVAYRKLEGGEYVSLKRFHSGDWGNDTFSWSFKRDLLDEVRDITEAQACLLLSGSDVDYVLHEQVVP